MATLPETNIAPEDRLLEKEIPIGNHHQNHDGMNYIDCFIKLGPGTRKIHFKMAGNGETTIFSCKDLESSNWNNRL